MAGSDWTTLHTYVCILGWTCHFRRARNLGLERIFCGEVDGDRRIRISILSFIHSVTSLKMKCPSHASLTPKRALHATTSLKRQLMSAFAVAIGGKADI